MTAGLLVVGSGLLGTSGSIRAERELTAKADAILDLLGLADIRDKRDLSKDTTEALKGALDQFARTFA